MFGSYDAKKVHAVAAPSTCRSQNVQSTPGALSEAEMKKNSTPLWPEEHAEVKNEQKHQVRSPFGS